MENIKMINDKRYMEYPFEQKWSEQIQMWTPITENDRAEWARRMKAKTGYKNPMWLEKHPEYVPPTQEELDAIVFEPYDQVMAIKPGTNMPNQEMVMDMDVEMEGGKRKRKHHKKTHKKSHKKSHHKGGKKVKKTYRKHKKTHHKRK